MDLITGASSRHLIGVARKRWPSNPPHPRVKQALGIIGSPQLIETAHLVAGEPRRTLPKILIGQLDAGCQVRHGGRVRACPIAILVVVGTS
jgi:hypothetical protein